MYSVVNLFQKWVRPLVAPLLHPLLRNNPPLLRNNPPLLHPLLHPLHPLLHPLLHPMKYAQDNHFVTCLVYRNLRRPSRISALSLSSASCTFRASNPMSRLFIFTTWPMESLDNLGFKRARPLQLLCRSLLKGLFLFSLGMLEKKYI